MRPFSAAILPTLGLALVAGVLSGLLRAAASLGAERYAELGMPGLVLWTLERAVLGAVLSFAGVAVAAVLLCWAWDAMAVRLGRRRPPPAIVPCVALALLAATVPIQRYDYLALVPSLRTVPGIALAASLFMAVMALLLWAVRRWHARSMTSR